MSVLFRLHQDQSVGTKRSGKWYARMVPTGTIDTRGLAEIMQRNCTVKRSDILAVIEEMVETMRDQLQDSKRVKLNGFGSFKIGLNCRGARSARAFTVTDNIEGLHIVFTPERTHDQAGNRVKQFLQGVKVEELPMNKVDKDEEEGE
jgi:predicted histone-like DNA-binding protein